MSKLRKLTYPENVVSDIGSGTNQAGWRRIETALKGQRDKPASGVRSVYRKLNKYSVEYVLDSITNCRSKVINIRAMIMTALYNATITAALT